MLAKRIILLLLYKDGVLYRTKKFIPDYRYTDNFVSNIYADEIVIIDISENHKNKKKLFLNAVSKISNNCFVPITVGGKISNLEEINTLQSVGADKIVLSTLAYKDPNMVEKIISKFGSQFVTISIDVNHINNRYEIFVNNGKEKLDNDLDSYLKYLLDLSPGEILINSISRDGSLNGLDVELCKHIKGSTSIPIIAAGGFGNWNHAFEIFKKSDVDGVCTSNVFHFTEKSLYSLKEYLKKEKINVR